MVRFKCDNLDLLRQNINFLYIPDNFPSVIDSLYVGLFHVRVDILYILSILDVGKVCTYILVAP